MATTRQHHQRTSLFPRDRSPSGKGKEAYTSAIMHSSRGSLSQVGGSQPSPWFEEASVVPFWLGPKPSTGVIDSDDVGSGLVSRMTSADPSEAASGGRSINWAPRSDGQSAGQLEVILTPFVSPDLDKGTLRGTKNRPVEAAGVFLRACGLISFAERISELSELRSHERRMGSLDSPVAIESLVSATSFFLTGKPLAAPTITLTSDGLLLCRWTLDPSGYIALLFRSDGEITYSALRPSPKGNGDPYRVRGTECQTSVRNIVDLASQWIQTT